MTDSGLGYFTVMQPFLWLGHCFASWLLVSNLGPGPFSFDLSLVKNHDLVGMFQRWQAVPDNYDSQFPM